MRQTTASVPWGWSTLIAVLPLLAAAATVSGCASARARFDDTGHRGLFQPMGSESAFASGALEPPHVAVGDRVIFSPSINSPSRYGFRWPIDYGTISSLYGPRRRDFHEGIDIQCRRGTPVYAAKSGVVIYSGHRIRGYGNMVVLKHDDGFATVYAHNRKNLVRVGEHVTQGQIVAFVGATGRATGPHLHFEVRRGDQPQNPLLFLPRMQQTAVARK